MDYDPIKAAEEILREHAMALVPSKKISQKQQEQAAPKRRNMLGVVLWIDRDSALVEVKNSLTGKNSRHRATQRALEVMLHGVRSGAIQQIALEDDLIVGFAE